MTNEEYMDTIWDYWSGFIKRNDIPEYLLPGIFINSIDNVTMTPNCRTTIYIAGSHCEVTKELIDKIYEGISHLSLGDYMRIRSSIHSSLCHPSTPLVGTKFTSSRLYQRLMSNFEKIYNDPTYKNRCRLQFMFQENKRNIYAYVLKKFGITLGYSFTVDLANPSYGNDAIITLTNDADADKIVDGLSNSGIPATKEESPYCNDLLRIDMHQFEKARSIIKLIFGDVMSTEPVTFNIL